MINPIPSLPPEPLFDCVVQRCGGRRVDEILGTEIDQKNADYYFQRENIIAELKEIQSDLSDDNELKKKAGDILNKYAGMDGVPIIFGTMPVRIDLLPEVVRREIFTPFKRKLELYVKEAGRQIKSTKLLLEQPDAKGLLILVNEASSFLRPDIVFFFLHHILKGQHTSIDRVVYCSVNMGVEIPGSADVARFWADAVPEGRRDVPDIFMSSLSAAFMATIDQQVGLPSRRVYIESSVLESGNMVPKKLSGDLDDFVRPGKFYRNEQGFAYYCESISEGTATMYLVESRQHGQLIQAIYDQKLIYANAEGYKIISDRDEIKRLRALLKEMKKR